MTTGFKKGFVSIVFIILSSFYFTATAQSTYTKSRVAVVANELKTNIWVSDFPKKTTIVIMDIENNLLSVISTNDYGSAFLTIPESIKTGITVKTLDGEIKASNTAVIKNTRDEQTVVNNTNNDINKA